MPAFHHRLRHARPLAFVLMVLAAPSNPSWAQDTGAPADEAAARIPAVTVAETMPREFLQRVPIVGTLVPREEVLVHPGTSGSAILELIAEVGDRVEAGQVLAHLDSRALLSQVTQSEAELVRAAAGVRQAQSQVLSAEASLTQAGQVLSRTGQLREGGTATQAALDDAQAANLTAEASRQSARDGVAVAEAQLQQIQASLDVARLNLGFAEIAAPVAGIVSARNGQVGGIAGASGEPIYRIIRDGLVEVEAEVIETHLALVAEGDPAELDVAGLPGVPGTVRTISPVVDPASRLGTVRIAAEPQDGLRPGLFAGGWITVERRDGIAVPATAVITDAEGDHVLLVASGVIERRAVTTGLLWQDWREIVEGLETGDEVVARAGAFFGDGDVIRPVRAGDAAADPESGDDARAGGEPTPAADQAIDAQTTEAAP